MVNSVAESIAHLTSRGRMSLLLSLLAEEICNRPYGDRQEQLKEVLDFLPVAVGVMEEELRADIAKNARGG